MRTEFYFVRHAQPNYENRDDMSRELTEKGLADRLLVTRYLEKQGIQVVLSSPFRRAVDTVKDYADRRGLPVECVDGFRERRIDSVWIEDFDSFARRQWEDFDYRLSGGECLREVQSRNIGALEQALERYRGKRIAVGSHGAALSAILQYYDNSFGYEGFLAIRDLMPWVARLVFEADKCVRIDQVDLFAPAQKVN